MTDKNKDFAEAIHMEIHAVRRLPGYKPSVMERNISRLVIDRFADTCKECKERKDQNTKKPDDEKKSFLGKIGDMLDDS